MSELRSNEERWAKLAKAATPGPWAIDETTGFEYHVRTSGTTCAIPSTGEPIADAALDCDASFIAAAREAVPALLAEVTRLRTENERLTERAEQAEAAWVSVAERAASSGAEVSQLRAKIDAFLSDYDSACPDWWPRSIDELRDALAEPSGTPVSDKLDSARVEAVDEVTRKIAALQTRRYGIMPPTLGDAIDEVRLQCGLPAFTTEEWSGLS